jgi:hypothetical protein
MIGWRICLNDRNFSHEEYFARQEITRGDRQQNPPLTARSSSAPKKARHFWELAGKMPSAPCQKWRFDSGKPAFIEKEGFCWRSPLVISCLAKYSSWEKFLSFRQILQPIIARYVHPYCREGTILRTSRIKLMTSLGLTAAFLTAMLVVASATRSSAIAPGYGRPAGQSYR